MAETYAETAVLVAVMDDLPDDAREKLSDFLPNELIIFAMQAELLSSLIEEAMRNRGVIA